MADSPAQPSSPPQEHPYENVDVEPLVGAALVLEAPMKRPQMAHPSSSPNPKPTLLRCPRCKQEGFKDVRALGQHAMRCQPASRESSDAAEEPMRPPPGDRFGRMLHLKKLQKQHELAVRSKAEQARVEAEMAQLVKMEKAREQRDLELRRRKEAEEAKRREEARRKQQEKLRLDALQAAKEKKERELQERAKLLLGDSESDSDSSQDAAAEERRKRLEEQFRRKQNGAKQIKGQKQRKARSVDETRPAPEGSSQRKASSGDAENITVALSSGEVKAESEGESGGKEGGENGGGLLGEDGEECPYEGYTWAHLAAYSNDAKRLKELEKDFLSADPDGLTPLHICALYGSIESLEVLLEHQLSSSPELKQKLTRQVDVAGRTALLCACFTGNFNVVAWLLQVDEEAIRIPDNEGNSPLMIASSYNSFDCVNFLLQFNADANGPPNAAGSFAIHMTSSAEIVRTLVEHGADYYAFDAQGRSALMLASGASKIHIVEYLIELYQKPEYIGFPDFAGDTCLHAAAVVGSADIIRVLLDAGVDRSGRNAIKLRALEMAEMMNHPECIKLLRGEEETAGLPEDKKAEAEAYVQAFHRSFVGEGMWVECVDEKSGHTYYYNTATMTATWEKPKTATVMRG